METERGGGVPIVELDLLGLAVGAPDGVILRTQRERDLAQSLVARGLAKLHVPDSGAGETLRATSAGVEQMRAIYREAFA